MNEYAFTTTSCDTSVQPRRMPVVTSLSLQYIDILGAQVLFAFGRALSHGRSGKGVCQGRIGRVHWSSSTSCRWHAAWPRWSRG